MGMLCADPPSALPLNTGMCPTVPRHQDQRRSARGMEAHRPWLATFSTADARLSLL